MIKYDLLGHVHRGPIFALVDTETHKIDEIANNLKRENGGITFRLPESKVGEKESKVVHTIEQQFLFEKLAEYIRNNFEKEKEDDTKS
jgi:hypothetical protein